MIVIYLCNNEFNLTELSSQLKKTEVISLEYNELQLLHQQQFTELTEIKLKLQQLDEVHKQKDEKQDEKKRKDIENLKKLNNQINILGNAVIYLNFNSYILFYF